MSEARILIVEDNEETQLLIRRALGKLGATISVASTAKEAQAILAQGKQSLIVLDVSLPDRDGFQLFSDIQAAGENRDTPVIFLTGHNDVTKKVTAFSMGAEDYVVKPFDALELKARVEAKLKRITAQSESSRLLTRGSLRLDAATQRVFSVTDTGEERLIQLTPREFKLLFHLARHEEQILSRGQLLDAVWGDGKEVFDRTVDAHVSSIRKKLGALSCSIESVPGAGYRFTSQAQPKRKQSAA